MINEKQLVGEKAIDWVHNNTVIGLGTGSTAYYFILKLAEKVKQENLNIQVLTSSDATEQIATSSGLKIITLEECEGIDLYVDGADEVDPQMNLIKGRGGAMVQEKILAASAKQFVVIAGSDKMVSHLGSKFPVPVECLPKAVPLAKKALEALGAQVTLRRDSTNQNNIKTDQNNFILDAQFSIGDNYRELDVNINQIPGVLGHGIFLDLAHTVITIRNQELSVIS